MSAQPILKGFDYRTYQPVEKRLNEWRKEATEIISHGGRRRVVDGETYIYAKHSDSKKGFELAFEVYGNVDLGGRS